MVGTLRFAHPTRLLPSTDATSIQMSKSHTPAFSRRVSRPSCCKHRPRKPRGRREGRVLAAPMVRLQTKSRRRHHRFSQNIRPSLHDGFNGVLRALPGDRAFLPPSSSKRAFARSGNLAPASGRQDHTTSPYATSDDRLTRGRVHRIPQPTFVTIAKRPSARPRDGRKGARDLPDAASAIACGMLARRANCAWVACADCPSGKIGCAR
jgi:hypothetical protein